MNDYFLHHAIETAKVQLIKAGIVRKVPENELINLAMQLSIVDKLDTIAGDIKDVESELVNLQKQMK